MYNLFSPQKLVYKLRNCNLILFDVYRLKLIPWNQQVASDIFDVFKKNRFCFVQFILAQTIKTIHEILDQLKSYSRKKILTLLFWIIFPDNYVAPLGTICCKLVTVILLFSATHFHVVFKQSCLVPLYTVDTVFSKAALKENA